MRHGRQVSAARRSSRSQLRPNPGLPFFSIWPVPGLDGAGSAKLLAILAPLVLSALGKMNSGASANAGGGGLDLGSIAGILGGATRAFSGGSQPQQQQQQSSSPGGGIFNAILDQDGDGQVGIGEIFGAAQKLGLFGKR